MAAPTTRSLQVVVVGAGPAGLCAAAALRQDGHGVTVLERQPSLQSRGNALVIQPAAVRALSHLRGAHAALAAASVRGSDALRYWSYRGDAPFAAVRMTGVRRFETDRPSVQRVMHEIAVRDGVEVSFGRNVERVEDSGDKATLWTSDGQAIESDLIVGADGIKSGIRKCLFPDRDTDPVPLRESIFLATLPLAEIRDDPALTAWLVPENTTHGTLGPGRFVLSRHLPGGKYGAQFIDVDHGPPGAVDGTWNTPADVPALRERFADFNDVTRAFLRRIESAERWQIAVGPELASWRSARGGRVVLLGDAAHAMVPHAAQGLSQGIEDGIGLARVLRGADQGRVGAATRAWEALRKPRAELFVQRSLNNARLRSLPDGAAQEARDAHIMRLASAKPAEAVDVKMDMKADQNSPEFIKWVREYDVVAEVNILQCSSPYRVAC